MPERPFDQLRELLGVVLGSTAFHPPSAVDPSSPEPACTRNRNRPPVSGRFSRIQATGAPWEAPGAAGGWENSILIDLQRRSDQVWVRWCLEWKDSSFPKWSLSARLTGRLSIPDCPTVHPGRPDCPPGRPRLSIGQSVRAARLSIGSADCPCVVRAAVQSEQWCRASSEQEAVPEFGGQRPSLTAVLVLHLEHELSDLLDGAVHHHQEGARRAAGRRCIDAAGAASLPPPRRSHRLQPDRRLHSMCGRRPSGDAFASIFDASNPAELGSSLLASSSLPRSSVCTRWWW